jgi:hypothetical protein
MKTCKKTSVVLCAVGLLLVAFTLSYLKLFVMGWDHGMAWAIGSVHIQVGTPEDAERLRRIDALISTPSTEVIEVTSGVVTGPPFIEGYSIRLMLNGRQVSTRAKVQANPWRVVYQAPNEDSVVTEQLFALAKNYGVESSMEIHEILTPLTVITNR